MLYQTLNGDPIIIHAISNYYVVYYNGERIDMMERPMTDQDVEQEYDANHEIVLMLSNTLINLLSTCIN